MIRTYTQLIKIRDFVDRYKYLKLGGYMAEETFGSNRYLNQMLYRSDQWKKLRSQVITRDLGLDLACEECPIPGTIYIHHMNPITKNDIIKRKSFVMNPDYLVCVSYQTHYAIHYGTEEDLPVYTLTVRSQNDTVPWKT